MTTFGISDILENLVRRQSVGDRMNHIHSEVQTQFGNSPEYYAASQVHGEGYTLAVIVEFAQPTGSERVLDVATGTGFAAFAVAPKVARVTATDLTYGMLVKARELASERGLSNIEFQVAAAESLPFAAESFDIVTCRIAPHHFQDVRAFLSGEPSRAATFGFVLHDRHRLSRVGTTNPMAKSGGKTQGCLPRLGVPPIAVAEDDW